MNSFPGLQKTSSALALWAIMAREVRGILRDRKTIVTMVVLPMACILVLGLLLGENFGRKSDDHFRISLVDLDQGKGLENQPWGEWVRRDLRESPDLRIELIGSVEEAEELVASHRRAAVIVLGPELSEKINACSFLSGGINPFHRDGVDLQKIGVRVIKDPRQGISNAIIEQVAQVSMMRVVLPWMIGKAFAQLGDPEFIEILATGAHVPVPPRLVWFFRKEAVTLKELLVLASEGKKESMDTYKKRIGEGIQRALASQFSRYNLTGKTWASLVKANMESGTTGVEESFQDQDGKGWLRRGAQRYQVLVPSYTVLFLFLVVMPVAGTFVLERQRGTWTRLVLSPIARWTIVLGKSIPFLLMSIFQGALLLILGKIVFGMSWGPDHWSIGTQAGFISLLLIATSISAVSIALFVGSFAQTMSQVSLWGIMPSLALALLGGCILPRELFPEQSRWISFLTPHGWALEGFRELLDGTKTAEPSIGGILNSCLVLVLIGVFLWGISWVRLLRQMKPMK